MKNISTIWITQIETSKAKKQFMKFINLSMIQYKKLPLCDLL